MRNVIIAIVIGIYLVAAALIVLALTNKPSQDVKFTVRHLLSYRPIDQRSRLQLLLEGGFSLAVGSVLLWLLLNG